jgi:hypothetical protein
MTLRHWSLLAGAPYINGQTIPVDGGANFT